MPSQILTFPYRKLYLQDIIRKMLKQGMVTCLLRSTTGDRQKTLKIKTLHTTKCRAYPHEKLNTSNGVIRSRELALATEDEIASALGKRSYKYKENLH